MDGGGTSSSGNGWNVGGSSAERNAWSNHSASGLLKPEPTANAIVPEEDAAWVTKSTSNQNSSWGAAVEKTEIASNNDQTGGWGKGGGGWDQAEPNVGSTSDNWKNKGNDLDGNEPSGWGQDNGWKSGSSDGAKDGSAWGKMKSGSDVIAEKHDFDWGKTSDWNSVSSDAGGSRGSVWGQLIDSTEKKSEADATISWDQDGGKSGSADGMNKTSNWGACKSGSCSGNENKEANWASRCAAAGSSHSNWATKPIGMLDTVETRILM